MEEAFTFIDEFSSLIGINAIELIVLSMAIIILIVIFTIAVLSYSKVIMNISYFVYPNTRVKAIGVPFVNSTAVNLILESKNISDATNKINDVGYNLNISDAKEPEKLERALNILYANECEEIIPTLPDSVKPFFRAYLSMLESEQIKVALKVKRMKLSSNDIRNRLIPTGVITDRIIDDIAESESIEDILLILQKTGYSELLSDALIEYTKINSTLPFELALDKFTFDELKNTKQQVDIDMSDPIYKFIKVYADVSNIKIILRAKNDDFDSSIVEKYILPGGSISMERVKEMSEYRSVLEIISNLKNTKYGIYLEKGIQEFELTNSIYSFELELDRFILDFVSNLSTTFHLGVGPLINFIVSKKYEIRNLKAILTGLAEEVPISIIKPVLITYKGVDI